MLIHDVMAPRGQVRGWALVLHGLGDTRHGWKDVAPMLGLDGWGFVFAQAPDAYGPGWSWFDLPLPDTRPDPAGVARSRTALEELVAHLGRERGIAPAELALIGFSQGCLMALELALTGAERFRAVVGISGWVYGMERFPAGLGAAAQAQRVLMTHGHWDPVIPIDRTRPQAQRLKALGLAVEWREYDKDHGLDPQDELADIRRFLQPG